MDGSATNPNGEPATNAWPGGVVDEPTPPNGTERTPAGSGGYPPAEEYAPRVFEPVAFEPAEPPAAPAGGAEMETPEAAWAPPAAAWAPRAATWTPPADEPSPAWSAEANQPAQASDLSWATPASEPAGAPEVPEAPEAPANGSASAWTPPTEWTPPAEWTPPTEWTPPAEWTPPPEAPEESPAGANGAVSFSAAPPVTAVEPTAVEPPPVEPPAVEPPAVEPPLVAPPPALEPVAAEPALAVAESLAAADVTAPDVTAPDVTAPDVTAPEVTLGEAVTGEAAVGEFAHPSPPPVGWREVGFDTVVRAITTPDEHQPYQELGLLDDEYSKIRLVLDRRPTESELAMYSIMWSEHCSYKSSKIHLRQFVEKAPPSRSMLAGIGENAGVVKVSDNLAVTFKVESHNHPSFVEPYQGAATGVGGIVRDILAMGARPVAVMDPLRFGAADHEDTRRVLPGVVAGIGGYGNCLGLPNIGGEVVFDECYQGNPLVNALCVGVLPVDRLQRKAAAGPGNVVVLVGAKTGRDGIGGVSVLASAAFTDGGERRRPSVQVGDPFLEKLLIEACLELYDLNLVVGIQDLGGAGLTCALSETAAAAGTGMAVNLDLVPLREGSMTAPEVLASESQERMLLVVTPENLPVVLSICSHWGLLATAIGEVTPPEADGGRLRIWWRGEVIVDVPPGSLADEGPVYARPMREPNDREIMAVDRAETLPRPSSPADLRATLLRMVGSPNLCDKSWVTEQYDRYVLGNTVLAQPEDAGVLRIDETTGLGIALSVDGNGRYSRLDPYAGARLALAEAYRNVAMTGATPVAVTNCLNFGSPEDPGVMWQFAEAVRGLADGCQELGIPVTGGNVSFYNQTGGAPIHPTPIVGVLGLLSDVAQRVPIGFAVPGDQIFLLGETREELSGSEWAHVTFQHLGGSPPVVDLAAEQRLAGLVAESARNGHVTAAHDLSDGGLAQALVEACLRRNVGAQITLPAEHGPFVQLFAESTARAVVSVRQGQEAAFTALAAERGVPCIALGQVQVSPVLAVEGQFQVPLDELRAAYTATLPSLFG